LGVRISLPLVGTFSDLILFIQYLPVSNFLTTDFSPLMIEAYKVIIFGAFSSSGNVDGSRKPVCCDEED